MPWRQLRLERETAHLDRLGLYSGNSRVFLGGDFQPRAKVGLGVQLFWTAEVYSRLVMSLRERFCNLQPASYYALRACSNSRLTGTW